MGVRIELVATNEVVHGQRPWSHPFKQWKVGVAEPGAQRDEVNEHRLTIATVAAVSGVRVCVGIDHQLMRCPGAPEGHLLTRSAPNSAQQPGVAARYGGTGTTSGASRL